MPNNYTFQEIIEFIRDLRKVGVTDSQILKKLLENNIVEREKGLRIINFQEE